MANELFRKRMEIYGTPMVEICNNTEYELNLQFKNNPSYHLAKLVRCDNSNTEIEIDVVLANTDKSTEKTIHVRPNTVLSEGDYIYIDDEDKKTTYLIDDFEDNSLSPYANGIECNQVLTLSNGKTYPCIFDNSAYGSKTLLNSDLIGEVDTRAKLIIQNNEEILNDITVSKRFMFNHSKYDIYMTTDIQTSFLNGRITMIMKKDEYIKDYDDLENNKAWNQDALEPEQPSEEQDIEIIGSEEIRKGQEYKYITTQAIGEFELIDYSNCIEIISKDSTQITIKAKEYGCYAIINYVVNDVILTAKNIETVR